MKLAKHATPFPTHARNQLKERYGKDFSDWDLFWFGRTLHDKNKTIRLSDTRQGRYFCACYFAKHWFLLLCSSEGTVVTAYPRLDISDEDKLALVRDKRYRQIGDDQFRVMANTSSSRSKTSKAQQKFVDIVENMRRDAYREFNSDTLDDNWWQ